MLARQFAAARLSNCEWPRPPLSCTIISRKFCGVCGNVFRPSGSLSMKRPAPKPNDSCRREIDLAVTVIEHKKRSGIRSRALLELPLILLVKATPRLTRADELWGRDKIEETLITFRRSDPVSVHFQVGLQQLGVEWFPGIEVNSARLIECYVAHGYGIGLSVATPGFKTPKGIRALKLPDFPKVMIGATWTGKLSAIAQQFLAEVEHEATSLRKSRVATI